jgi:superfamily II DNA or RNA helicase/SAM-dependent methyltransferase/SOS-response transcriptional repressor LexA
MRMNSSVDYYNVNAACFFSDTVAVDMSSLRTRFLGKISNGGHILDAGCGSGRDTKAFLELGYRVTAFDAADELAALAAEHTGITVQVRSFEDIHEHGRYDGIWACASLLHLSEREIPAAIERCWNALKPGGAFYLSFKLGRGTRVQGSRHFTDTSEAELRTWCASLPEVHDIECWVTADQRPGRTEQWLNALLVRSHRPRGRLVTGGADPFLPHLCAGVNHATQIELAVAFVKATGLRLLLPDLLGALGVAGGRARGAARMRILTSDYLDVTDPEALRLLMLLKAQGAEVRVYESARSSFHLKAYIFSGLIGDGPRGIAFIGSSNISRQALQTGLEWNMRADYPEPAYLEAKAKFEELYADEHCVSLTDAWIDQYERRRLPLLRAIAPGSNEVEPAPEPTPVQRDALLALATTREDGFRRGLVVLATGLGKTWLAAFDAIQIGARRILFVAHREEILQQAAETFVRIRPGMRVGFYMGQTRDAEVDVLCASVQTLSRDAHLERFSPQHFDYMVVDEFHHASAPTYRRLLSYFAPQFMLGLTATPDRTDQSDILTLCDENLVFTCGLFAGIKEALLAPFHYYGIFDGEVDYASIPWRNGRFDPEQLSHKLATLARARHVLREWQRYQQSRTLAFCASTAHAEYMATQFIKAGVACAAVYSGSHLSRADALERLNNGQLSVIFSVDLFNEGVDLPSIDTVMMLRPTESKILFLQQLGRGLRKSDGKDRLVVLDFIGNHQSFLHKPQALFNVGTSYKSLATFARKASEAQLELPDGCYVNFDLRLLDFLRSLDSEGVKNEYHALRQCLGRRPTATEFFRAGASMLAMRRQYGGWFDMVTELEDLDEYESEVVREHQSFLREVETTAMTKCFKMILLQAMLELDGWKRPPSVSVLAELSWNTLQRRPNLLPDLPESMRGSAFRGTGAAWAKYWSDNPSHAWVGGNQTLTAPAHFRVFNGQFMPVFEVSTALTPVFNAVVQELVDLRLAQYEMRRSSPVNVVPISRAAATSARVLVPYFPSLKIACGHFRTSSSDVVEYRNLGDAHGHLDPARHFIARAKGDSMDGGKHPIRDGDYLLFEHISPTNAGSLTGATVAIERDSGDGGSEYLLRVVAKSDGQYVLRAQNPRYEEMVATDEMRTLARFKEKLDPLEMALNQSLMREQIPELFDEVFSPGNWQSGHITLNDKKAHILLVTLNKQGKAAEHRYTDHWIDERHFHWQSQNSTSPKNKRGREIIEHQRKGITVHLFVRETKLHNGKAAPFTYHGKIRYVEHSGSQPMNVKWELE